MYAVYGFCRAVDDIADGDLPAAVKLDRLAWWREEIARTFAGCPGDPVSHALLGPIRSFGLPQEEFLEVIAGMEMDARGEMVAPEEADLALYCRRVAGAVGLLSLPVFGADDPRARPFAVVLGEALQLTNILRDLAEDARLGRLYLPRELLQGFGIAERAPAAVLAHPALPALCQALADRSEQRYAEARRQLAELDGRRLRAAIAMMAVYRRLLRRLRSGAWRRLDPSPRLGTGEKLWIALRAAVFARP
jgi:phytoene synthase